MVDIGYDRRTLTDSYSLIKQKDTKKYLEHEKVPLVRFLAKDYIDYSSNKENIDNVARREAATLTITTYIVNSKVKFQPDDLVVNNKTRQIWRILSVTASDDGQMKEFSNRPRTWYILSLIA